METDLQGAGLWRLTYRGWPMETDLQGAGLWRLAYRGLVYGDWPIRTNCLHCYLLFILGVHPVATHIPPALLSYTSFSS